MVKNYSHVRGFNYQPGYGSCSYENWMWFDARQMKQELEWGKSAFPNLNTIRLWLSWDAYLREPVAFLANFEKALELCDSLGIQVIPVLFNRWHNAFCDNGGIYAQRLLPGSQMYSRYFFQPYLEAICTPYKNDSRVLLWDLCNEPFSYNKSFDKMRPVVKAEIDWITDMSDCMCSIGVSQDVGISIHGSTNREMMEAVAPISTVFLIHPYLQWTADAEEYDARCRAVIEHLDWQVCFAKEQSKGILVTECCWGSIDDDVFADNIRRSLTEYTKRGLGFVAHALCHSEVADLHAPKYGPILADMGQFNFLDQNGRLRPGLEVFNSF